MRTEPPRQRQHRIFLAVLLCTGLLLALWPFPKGADAQGQATLTPPPPPTLPPQADLPHYGEIVQMCGQGVQPRGPDFAGTGFIVTVFSRDALWVVDLDRGARYPLPDTRPCGPNCLPSPDRRRLLYVSPETYTYWLMNLDGTGREQVTPYYVTAVEWWDAAHWLIWPAVAPPYLQAVGSGERTPLGDYDVFSVQPGGFYGLRLRSDDPWPVLELVDTQTGNAVALADWRPYFGGAYWSPDGSRLVYLGQGERDRTLGFAGAELFLIRPGEAAAVRLTDLTAAYGAARIAGMQEERAVSWSPDGTRLAFWVMEITGPDVAANVGQAVLHVLDATTGQTTAYCGYGTTQITPNPPALIWSPDGRYIAFGADTPGDGKGALLLALDTQSGTFTEITDGIYPAYGTYDPVMWGVRS